MTKNLTLSTLYILASIILTNITEPNIAHAQRHAHTWDFGEQCRITWAADGQSFTTTNSAISTNEGCTTFSDPQSGTLLLYSDGIQVWRADNTPILNNLGGSPTSMHSGVVIPAPGRPNHVYVLGVPAGNSTTLGFHLFNLNSGIAVPSANTGAITFSSPATEGLVTVPHTNGIDQWLIRKGQNGAFVIPVTSTGFGTPTFYAGSTGVTNDRHIFGLFTISHDGRKLAHSGREGNIGLFDFDPASGVLSNHTILTLNAPFNSQIYGGEFSPDNTKLYFSRLSSNGTNNVGGTSSITQYDLMSDIFTIISAGSPNFTYAATKLGPDDKIYVASGNRSVQTLDVIDNPNAPGASVTYRKDAITMPAGCDVRLGLTQTPSVKSNIATVGRLTNLNSPVACGNVTPSGVINAPDNTVVTVNIEDNNGAVLGSCTNTSSNYAFTCTTPIALNMSGDYRAVTQYTSNNNTFSMAQTFTVDCDAPSITLTTPADGTVSMSSTLNVSGTTEPGATVTILVKDANGNTVQTLTPTVDTQGNYIINTAQLADGTYTIEATAVDVSGNISMNAGPNMFTVDTQAPLIAIANVPSPTNDNTPTFSGVSDPATVSVVVRNDQGNIVQTLNPTVDAQGNWTIDASQLPDGNYTVEATATDDAGNTSQPAGPISFIVDTIAPPLTIVAPTDGTTTNDDTPTINGTTEPGAVVEVTITDSNGAVVQTLNPTVDAMGGWTIDAAQLPEGDYTINATATDNAGNQAAQGPVSINIDTTAPTLTITTPTNGELVNKKEINITGTSDPNQTMIIVEIIDNNGTTVDIQTVSANSNGNWTTQTQDLSNGQYKVRVTTSDEAGNKTTSEISFAIDTNEPLITIIAPTNGTVTSNVRPDINGTADTDANVVVEVKDAQGNVVATFQPTVDMMGNWMITLDSDLADGDYTIEATSTRPNGKVASTSVELTVDTTNPTTTITSPADGMVGSMNQPNVTGTSEPGAEVVVTFKDDQGNVVETVTTTADDQGNWTATPTNALADGQYTIDAEATDGAGNTASSDPVVITIDNQTPSVQITMPAEGDTLDTTTPTISGTAEPNTTVEIFVDGEKIGETTTDDNGMWTFDIPEDQALGEGEHTIEAQAIDPAGNRGFSGQVTVKVDTSTTPTIDSPKQGATVDGPTVTVTGTGKPRDEIEVTIGDETKTVTVDEDGMWSTTFDNVPDGPATIEVSSGDKMATTDITVNASQEFILRGRDGCSTAPTHPASKLWLLAIIGLLFVRRRKTT